MDESIHQPHDKLFKSTFSDPGTATAFRKWRLSPGIAQAVDWDSAQPHFPNSQVTCPADTAAAG